MILGISGLAGSGKDTFARFLVEDHGFVVVSLADPLKRICRDVFDFSDEQLWGPSEKRNEPDFRYPREKCHGCQTCEFRCDHYLGYLTPRYALQRIGTEWGRDCYENIWVEYTMRTARKLLDPMSGDVSSALGYNPKQGIVPWNRGKPKGVAIPDVRFRNEIEGIRAAGGKLVRIRRPGAGLSGAAGVHASEAEQAGIPDDVFDLVVENTGTLEELRAKAAAALPFLRP